jgi:hypothetical protein
VRDGPARHRQAGNLLLGWLDLRPVRFEELDLLAAAIGAGIEEDDDEASSAGNWQIALALQAV